MAAASVTPNFGTVEYYSQLCQDPVTVIFRVDRILNTHADLFGDKSSNLRYKVDLLITSLKILYDAASFEIGEEPTTELAKARPAAIEALEAQLREQAETINKLQTELFDLMDIVAQKKAGYDGAIIPTNYYRAVGKPGNYNGAIDYNSGIVILKKPENSEIPQSVLKLIQKYLSAGGPNRYLAFSQTVYVGAGRSIFCLKELNQLNDFNGEKNFMTIKKNKFTTNSTDTHILEAFRKIIETFPANARIYFPVDAYQLINVISWDFSERKKEEGKEKTAPETTEGAV